MNNQLENNRVSYIDGIRGFASLSVVAFHFYWESLGVIIPEIKNPINAFIMNGGCAVIIFFILSGDSLSISFLKNRDEKKLIPIFLKRYLRLTFIILIVSLIIATTMKIGITYNKEASAILKSEAWLGSFLNFEAGFVNSITFAISNVYVGFGNNYNPFFWTMSFELLGSFFLILFCFCYNHIKNPDLIAFMCYLVFATLGSYLSLFFIGMLFAKARQKGLIEKIEKRISITISFILIIFFAVAISWISMQSHLYGRNFLSRLYFFICPAIIILLYSNKVMRCVFSTKVMLFLGRISYPLYAVHFIVLTTFFSYGITKSNLEKSELYLIAFYSMIISIIMAVLLEIIERKYLKILNIYVRKIIK